MGAGWRSGIEPAGPARLWTQGPFRLVRHPMFSFVLLGQLGLFLAVPSIFTLLCLLVGAVTLLRQAGLEEEALAQRHGETWRRWAEATPKWPWLLACRAMGRMAQAGFRGVHHLDVDTAGDAAEELVGDGAGGRGDGLDGKRRAPEGDGGAGLGVGDAREVEGDHVHRDAAGEAGGVAADQDRRARGGVAGIAVAIAHGGNADPRRALGPPGGGVAHGLARLQLPSRR